MYLTASGEECVNASINSDHQFIQMLKYNGLPELDGPFWRLLGARFYPLAHRALPETVWYKALGEPPNKLVVTK